MYRLLDSVAEGVIAGFIHVPSETVMAVETIARGLEIAVAASVEHARV
jgi:hypothetical protein